MITTAGLYRSKDNDELKEMYRMEHYHATDEEFMMNCTLFRVKWLVSNLKEGDKLLDVGCNGGWASLTAANNVKGVSAVGLDLNQKAINHANSVAKNNGLNCAFYCIDLFEYYPQKKYDAIALFEIVEHYKNASDMLALAESRLSKNGCIYISTPDLFGKFGYTNPDPWHINLYDEERLKSELLKGKKIEEFIKQDDLFHVKYSL